MNEEHQLLLYPTKMNLKAWDFKFSFKIGKKNIKKYEEEKTVVKPKLHIDLDCIRK